MGIEQQDFHRLGHRDELGDVRLDGLYDVHCSSVNKRWSVLCNCDGSMTGVGGVVCSRCQGRRRDPPGLGSCESLYYSIDETRCANGIKTIGGGARRRSERELKGLKQCVSKPERVTAYA